MTLDQIELKTDREILISLYSYVRGELPLAVKEQITDELAEHNKKQHGNTDDKIKAAFEAHVKMSHRLKLNWNLLIKIVVGLVVLVGGGGAASLAGLF